MLSHLCSLVRLCITKLVLASGNQADEKISGS